MIASATVPSVLKGPYPGLRPFYADESTYFFGRTRHSEELVKRLGNKSQFVAIIGGSGSGKSSLVRAGVIPRLRTYGIPDAGDLWIPLVMTPGTNPSSINQSPITRLARQFSTILKPLPSMEEAEHRIEEIAAIFRQEAGFERLLNCFASELAVPPGSSQNNARILFVIDQFEEIFHPTNGKIPDISVFVDRIVDHFFNPHPSCFIILTMRSEYLNYCPLYLELPDAINSSLYLVPRLDRDEICEAIVDPLRIFNRYLRRQNPEMTKIPIAPQFSTEVLERILENSDEISGDSDHLPLLQHLLARLWQVACDRGDLDKGAIDAITWDDLKVAVFAVAGVTIPKGMNVLRSCLENWASTAYLAFDEDERIRIDQILRQLAFKDPNTGTYTQQRLSLNSSALLLAESKATSDFLHRLRQHYIEQVSYLSVEKDGPDAESLKVSHESFIRGWKHFRELINKENERFEEFLNILRKCLAWSRSEKDKFKYLLGSPDLVHIEKANLQNVLVNEKDREDWFKVLEVYRDGKELVKAKPLVEKFYKESQDNEGQKKKKLEELERQKVYWGKILVAGVAAVVCLCIALGFIVPEWLLFKNELVPAASEVLLKKSNAVRVARLALANPGPKALDAVAKASSYVISANEKQTEILSGLGKRIYFQIPEIRDWLLDKRIRVLNEVLAGSLNDEPEVNYITRGILSNHIWQTSEPKDDQAEIPTPVKGPQEGKKCQFSPNSDKSGEAFIIKRHFVQGTNATGPIRSLLVTKNLGSRPNETVLLGNELGNPVGMCNAKTILFAIPNELKPVIRFDSNMRYLFVVTTNKATKIEVLTIYSLDWNWIPTDYGRAWKERIVITDESIIRNFSRKIGDKDVVGVFPGRTWVYQDGVVIKNGDTYWKIIFQEPTRQRTPAGAWAKLVTSKEESVCAKLVKGAPLSQKFSSLLYEDEDGGHCILISRGSLPSQLFSPSSAAVPGQDTRQETLAVVDIYLKASMDSKEPVQEPSIPLSRIEFRNPPNKATNWYMGMEKTGFEGWIALEVSPPDKGKGDYLIAPWSTESLRKIGCEIVSLSPTSLYSGGSCHFLDPDSRSMRIHNLGG